MVDWKGKRGNFGGGRTVLYLNCGDIYATVCIWQNL